MGDDGACLMDVIDAVRINNGGVQANEKPNTESNDKSGNDGPVLIFKMNCRSHGNTIACDLWGSPPKTAVYS